MVSPRPPESADHVPSELRLSTGAALTLGSPDDRTDPQARAPALTWLRVVSLGAVIACLPLGSLAVFGLGADRSATADVLAWAYSIGLSTACISALLPLPSLRTWSRRRRVQSSVLLFLVVSYCTHLTWELAWLLLHEQIAAARNSAWAYPWWAYIDGGDLRYASAPIELVSIEILSVLNGLIGVVALAMWRRSGGSDRRAIAMFMATAVVHLYSTAFYYLSEILAGLPSVDTTSFTDTFIKFGLANAPWLIMPWLVLWWGFTGLSQERRTT